MVTATKERYALLLRLAPSLECAWLALGRWALGWGALEGPLGHHTCSSTCFLIFRRRFPSTAFFHATESKPACWCLRRDFASCGIRKAQVWWPLASGGSRASRLPGPEGLGGGECPRTVLAAFLLRSVMGSRGPDVQGLEHVGGCWACGEAVRP